MGCIDISGVNVERNEDKILVSMSRSWSMLNPAEAVVRRFPDAATCRVDCATRLEPAADKNATAASHASWRTFTSPLQYETGSLFQKTNAPRYSYNPLWNTPAPHRAANSSPNSDTPQRSCTHFPPARHRPRTLDDVVRERAKEASLECSEGLVGEIVGRLVEDVVVTGQLGRG